MDYDKNVTNELHIKASDITGAPTPFVFKIRATETSAKVAAKNKAEYLLWLKAIYQNLSNDLAESSTESTRKDRKPSL